jgi:hypothetical protein
MGDVVGPGDEIEKEKVRLLEADLAQSNEFVKGVLSTSATIRGSAITIWLALLGFSVQQSIPTLAVLAAIVAVAFWLADGYHGWLYGEAFVHAQRIERLLASYYDDLSRRSDSPTAHVRFTAKLRAHRYGLYSRLHRGFNLKQLWMSSRPHIFYRGLYPALITLAAVVSLVGFLGADLKVKGTAPTRGTIEHPAAPLQAPTTSRPTPSPIPAPVPAPPPVTTRATSKPPST